MRNLTGLLSTLAMLSTLGGASAHAETPPVAAAARPNAIVYSSLPVGEIAKPLARTRLRHPAGSQRAEGFFVKREHKSYISVSGHKPAGPGKADPAASACLRTSSDFFETRHGGPPSPAPTWSPQAESITNLSHQTPLAVVHREEVVLRGDRATLETRDAVIDEVSLASKTVDQRSLALAKVAELASGVQVFAFRGGQLVELVVVAPSQALISSGMIVAHVSGDPQLLTASQCRHLRVTAPVARGEGTAATVLVRVIDGDPKVAPPKDGEGETTLRTLRTLAVHLSTSWLAGDPEPVVSVTAGWQGPSEKQRVPVADDSTGDI